MHEIYGVRLLAEGYDIVSAGDGEEALAMAIKERPQLIISDVMMPKISGFDMLDILRSTTETRDIKVIMMTALSSDDQRSRGEQLGADRYLVKSQVGIEDVVRTVHEVMGDSSKSDASPATATAPTPETTPAETPAETPSAPVSVAPEPVSQPVDTPSGALPATPAVADAPAISSPGNESAGPLPPQPSEAESALPQPTAPFSSPAPASLGEQITRLDESVNNTDESADLPAPSVDLVAAIENEPVTDGSTPSDTTLPPAGESAPSGSSDTGSTATDVQTPVAPVDSTDQQTPGTTPPAPGAPTV